MKGGEDGAVIVPGKSAESLLMKSIRHEDPDLKMPKKPDKLPEDELLADLKRVAGELQKSSVTVDEYNERGRQPKYSDLTSQTSKYSSGTYEYRFGTWRKALEAFVVWAKEGEAQPVETPLEKRVSGHRTSRRIDMFQND